MMDRVSSWLPIMVLALVALRNANHWMRGGVRLAGGGKRLYRHLLVNSIAVMPPWGRSAVSVRNRDH